MILLFRIKCVYVLCRMSHPISRPLNCVISQLRVCVVQDVSSNQQTSSQAAKAPETLEQQTQVVMALSQQTSSLIKASTAPQAPLQEKTQENLESDPGLVRNLVEHCRALEAQVRTLEGQVRDLEGVQVQELEEQVRTLEGEIRALEAQLRSAKGLLPFVLLSSFLRVSLHTAQKRGIQKRSVQKRSVQKRSVQKRSVQKRSRDWNPARTLSHL